MSQGSVVSARSPAQSESLRRVWYETPPSPFHSAEVRRSTETQRIKAEKAKKEFKKLVAELSKAITPAEAALKGAVSKRIKEKDVVASCDAAIDAANSAFYGVLSASWALIQHR